MTQLPAPRTLLAPGTSAASTGELNEVAVPTPSVEEPLPPPASVETTPLGAMRRSFPFVVSVTSKFTPAASKERAYGFWKAATAPQPSTLPVDPGVPAKTERVHADAAAGAELGPAVAEGVVGGVGVGVADGDAPATREGEGEGVGEAAGHD